MYVCKAVDGMYVGLWMSEPCACECVCMCVCYRCKSPIYTQMYECSHISSPTYMIYIRALMAHV